MRTLQDIQDLADQIAEAFSPERIILFGSYADGTPNPDSDVDLLVVADYEGKPRHLATAIRNRLKPKFPVDLLVRSATQIDERIELGDPFLAEITRSGRLLYEAAN